MTTISLATVLVACKLFSLLPPTRGVGGLASDLFVAVHEDLALAIGSGVVALALLLATRRWPRAERAVWGAWIVYSAACVAYAVISYQVYSMIYAPLTYRLVAVEGAGDAWSSVRRGVTLFIVVAIVVVTAAHVAVARLAQRMKRRPQLIASGLMAVVVVAAILVSFEGKERYEWRWRSRFDAPVGRSPHLVLARSLLGAVTGWGSGEREPAWDEGVLAKIQDLGADYPPEYEADFEPAPAGRLDPLEGAPPKNVLLYVLESVGTEYLDPYGSPYGVTPRMAEAASHGAVFDNFNVQVGKTDGSMVSMVLSTYLPLSWQMPSELLPDLPGTSLAHVLEAEGYRSALVTASKLSYGRQGRFLRERGFDQLLDSVALACPDLSSWGAADRCMVDGLLQWIDEDPERPFFVVGWTNQTHHPYPVTSDHPVREFDHPPLPSQLGDFNAYLNALSETDRELGRVLDGLRDRGLEEDTLLIITADHPEAFGERHPTFLHGFHVYEENVRVPFIVVDKRRFPEAKRFDTVASNVDVNPTIAHLLDLPAPGDWQGRSVFDPQRFDRAYYFASHGDLILGVREGPWKYILNLTTGREELYDLDADPHEQKNLVAEEAARRDRLRQRMAAWMHVQKRRYRHGRITSWPRVAGSAAAPE